MHDVVIVCHKLFVTRIIVYTRTLHRVHVHVHVHVLHHVHIHMYVYIYMCTYIMCSNL